MSASLDKVRRMLDPRRVRQAVRRRPGEKLALVVLELPVAELHVVMLAPRAAADRWEADLAMRRHDYLLVAMDADGEIWTGITPVAGLPIGVRGSGFAPPPAMAARMVCDLLDGSPVTRISEGWAAALSRKGI
jgi:hypothetical protein